MKKIFISKIDNVDNIIEELKEKYQNEELDIYISEEYIDIDAEPNKYGFILDKISGCDVAYFGKDHNKNILAQIEYQYCKDLGIEVITE